MRGLLATILAALLAATAAPAGDRLVVVELFTSQGCSSCPPADELLGDLTGREDILPLALHVDYWDYIGWKDSFASPVFTLRQKAYAHVAGARSIYTPQMIVGGVDHVVGTDPMKLIDVIRRHADTAPGARLRLLRNGGEVEVTATPLRPLSGRFVVLLVRYAPGRTVDITRGENAGRTITYRNIVEEMTEVGKWDGRGTFHGTAPVRGAGEFAAIVQQGYGPILAAARLN